MLSTSNDDLTSLVRSSPPNSLAASLAASNDDLPSLLVRASPAQDTAAADEAGRPTSPTGPPHPPGHEDSGDDAPQPAPLAKGGAPLGGTSLLAATASAELVNVWAVPL